jgi:hypothetical protein
MFEVGARADVQVEAGNVQAECLPAAQTVFELFVPDAVLRERPAGVRLSRVAVAKPGVNAQRYGHAGRHGGELFEHVGRAAIDGHAVFADEREGIVIEDVGGIDDGGRVATGGVAGLDSAVDLPGRDGVDDDPVLAHEREDGDVRAGFLGEADGLEISEFGDALFDDGLVIGKERRAIA